MAFSKDEEERARLMSEFKGKVDLQSHINHAKWEQSKKIALKMKNRGRPFAEIVEDTGLDIADIEEL